MPRPGPPHEAGGGPIEPYGTALQKSEALISSGDTVDRDMKNWFHSTPLPMMLCADQPMEYETIVIPEAGVTLGMAH
jgi:hypothetical protein